jgi:hypothetical protein
MKLRGKNSSPRTNPLRLHCYLASFPQHLASRLFNGTSIMFGDLFNADVSNLRGKPLDLSRSAARMPKTLSAGGHGPINGYDEYINNPLTEELSQLYFTHGVRHNLADSLHKQGKSQDAGLLQRSVLEHRRAKFGEDYPDTLQSYNGLGVILATKRKTDEAAVMYRRALDGFARMLRDRDLRTMTAMTKLGHVLKYQGMIGQFDELRQRWLRARDAYRQEPCSPLAGIPL